MAINLGDAKGYLDLDTSKFKGALKEAQDQLKQVTDSMSYKAGKAMQSVGDSMFKAGKSMTKLVTAPIVGVGTASVKTAATFESSMSKVAALSGATSEDLEKMSNKAKQMGATTRYSASEAADAMGYMALAGWDTNQMISGLDGVLNLAAASDMDLAQASDIVTDYLSAFGLEAKDATRLADEMAYAQAHSNTSTIQLSEAFSNSAANMHAAGQSMETTTAILEAFANQGTKGSKAGTQLAAIMRDVTNKMEDGAIKIGDTTIAVQDANGNFRDLIDIMADVEKATNGMGSAERSAALSSVFTAHSINGVNEILTEGTSAIKGYKSELEDAGGTAKEMADKMLDNLNGQLTILKSALEGLAIDIGERLMPYVKQGVEWVQKMVDKFQSLSDEQKDQVIKWAGIIAAIGPVLMIGGKLIGFISGVFMNFKKLQKTLEISKNLFKILSGSLSGISLPIIAVVAAVGILIAAFKNLWDNNEEFRNKIKSIWKSITSTFDLQFKRIKLYLQDLWNSFKEIIEALKPLWNGFTELLAPVFVKAFEFIGKALSKGIIFIADFLGWLAKTVRAVINFAKNFKTNFNNAKTTIKEFVKDAIAKAKNFIKEFVDKISNGLKSLPNKFKEKFNEIISKVKSWSSDMINKAKTTATNFLNNLVNGIKSLPGKVLNLLNQVIQNVINWASQFISNAINAASNFLSSIVNGISSLPGRVWGTLTSVISNVISFAADFVSRALQAGSDFVSNIWDTVKGLPDKFLQLGSDIVSGVWNGISEAWTWLYNKVYGWATDILETAKSALDINSPSKKFRDIIGVSIPEGIEKGVEKQMPKSLKSMSKELNDGIGYLQRNMSDLTMTARYAVSGDTSLSQSEMALRVKGGIDYTMLSQSMIDVLRTAPIQNNFSVEMEDGDILLDNERVGRKVAPVVSRVVAKDMKFA